MKKAEYYASTLNDLKTELTRQSRVLGGLRAIRKQLEAEEYEPLDSLDTVIAEWETRRNFNKQYIKGLEGLVK
jgi:hypothetical protein